MIHDAHFAQKMKFSIKDFFRKCQQICHVSYTNTNFNWSCNYSFSNCLEKYLLADKTLQQLNKTVKNTIVGKTQHFEKLKKEP